MGDGRYDSQRLIDAAAENAQALFLFDMTEVARQSGAIVSAVMLGAIAGGSGLPIPVEAFEAAISRDGKSVDSNLRGFRAGLAAVRERAPVALRRPGKRAAKPTREALEAEAAALPQARRARSPPKACVASSPIRTSTYARLYLDRLKPVAEADARANAGGKLLAETARHLAVRMSFEDVIRVAQAKIAPERFRRIEGEIGAKDQPYVITEFLKPGIEELCQVLPPRLARAHRRFSEKRGWLDTRPFRHGAEDHDGVGLSALLDVSRSCGASVRKAGAMPRSRSSIEAWLARVLAAAKLSGDLALEVAECARLIKGYGDTWKRGVVELRADRGARDRAGAGRAHRRSRKASTPLRARAPRRWSIPKARACERAVRRSSSKCAAAGGGVALSPHPWERVASGASPRSGEGACDSVRLPAIAALEHARLRGERIRTLRLPPYFASLTRLNCANPRSKSGPSVRSMLITRQIALPMKLCVPVMVQITVVCPPCLREDEIRVARALERLDEVGARRDALVRLALRDRHRAGADLVVAVPCERCAGAGLRARERDPRVRIELRPRRPVLPRLRSLTLRKIDRRRRRDRGSSASGGNRRAETRRPSRMPRRAGQPDREPFQEAHTVTL